MGLVKPLKTCTPTFSFKVCISCSLFAICKCKFKKYELNIHFVNNVSKKLH